MSRRAGMLLGCGVLASFAGGSPTPPTNSLLGLDRFGRIADLHYVNTGGTPAPHTVHRYQYAYDQSGNRRHARVQQWPFAAQFGIPAADHRSYAYEYDELQRLISADLGLLNAGSSTVPPAVDHPWRAVDWNLDNVGNWSGGVPGANDPPGSLSPSVVVALDLDEAGSDSPVVTRLHHDADGDNTVKSIAKQEFPATQPVATPQVYDIGGNLVWDGTYFYTYDAWSCGN